MDSQRADFEEAQQAQGAEAPPKHAATKLGLTRERRDWISGALGWWLFILLAVCWPSSDGGQATPPPPARLTAVPSAFLQPPVPPSPPPFDQFLQVATLVLPGGADWDFVTFDQAYSTIMVGRRRDGVTVVDASNLTALRVMPCPSLANATAGSNGVTLLPDLGLAVSNNGAASAYGSSSTAASGTVFALPAPSNNWCPPILGITQFTGLGNVSAARGNENSPGNSVYHRLLHQVAFTHHHRAAGMKSALVGYSLHPDLLAPVVGTPGHACPSDCLVAPESALLEKQKQALIPGKLHSPKVWDATTVWVAVEEAPGVWLFDLTRGEVTRKFDLAQYGCATPTPVDVDTVSGVLFIACAGKAFAGSRPDLAGLAGIPLFLVVDAETGALLYSSPVGRHVDAAVYVKPTASRTGRIFISCAGDPVILVFEQLAGGRAYRPLEAIATRVGTKTLAVDPLRGVIWTVAPAGIWNLGQTLKDVGGQLTADAVAATAFGFELFYPASPGSWQPGTFTLFAYQASNRSAWSS